MRRAPAEQELAALLVELGDLRESRSSDGAGRSVVPDFEASMAHVAAGLTETVARIRFPARQRWAVLHL
jgi:hypothetical protein